VEKRGQKGGRREGDRRGKGNQEGRREGKEPTLNFTEPSGFINFSTFIKFTEFGLPPHGTNKSAVAKGCKWNSFRNKSPDSTISPEGRVTLVSVTSTRKPPGVRREASKWETVCVGVRRERKRERTGEQGREGRGREGGARRREEEGGRRKEGEKDKRREKERERRKEGKKDKRREKERERRRRARGTKKSSTSLALAKRTSSSRSRPLGSYKTPLPSITAIVLSFDIKISLLPRSPSGPPV
jgi:hypothetical protein